MIKNVIHFLSESINNHFDVYLLIFIALTLTVVLAFYLARLRLIVFLGYLPLFIRNFLYRIVILGEVALFAGLIGVYWVNYQVAAELIRLPENVLVNTSWVKAEAPVYFIEDKQLHRIFPNGEGHRILYKSPYEIKEYAFSPDGEEIAIVTEKNIVLYYQSEDFVEEIDAIGEMIGDGFHDLKGVVRGVRWSKDSQKICYEINRWSRFSSQNNLYVYFLGSKQRKSVVSPGRKVSSVYWDDSSENLYYLYNEAMDTSQHGYPFDVKIYKIPLEKMKPELLVSFPSKDKAMPVESLAIRGIHLFLDYEKYSFGRNLPENSLISSKGAQVGIDAEDHLFYLPNRWFKKRLFRIDREQVEYIEPEYQKDGGLLTIQHIRWLPDGEYIVMEHKNIGILILEPKTKRIGRLYKSQGKAFGWYQTDV